MLADVTEDGQPDIITANLYSNDVSILPGLGSGTFAAPIIVPASFAAGAASVSCVRTGDFNGDGLVDLATANSARDEVAVMLGFGGGAFGAPQEYAVGASPQTIAVDDFDGDGLDDIASANYGDHTVTVLVGIGHI